MRKIQFRPSKWLTFGTIAALILFTMLGFWQLDRAEQKRTILRTFEQNSLLPAEIISAQSRVERPADYMYRKIQVSGNYMQNYLLALDNQHDQGKVGFHIYTPFKIVNSERVILVNRGWVAQKKFVREVPDVKTEFAQLDISGIGYVPSEPVIRLGNAESKINPRDIVQYIDLKKLSADLDLDLLPFILLLDKDANSGFKRTWQIISAPAEKSTSYAMQWFSFAILLLILYISLNIKRIK